VIFIDLRDREGLIQLVYDPDLPDVFSIAEQVRNSILRTPPRFSSTNMKMFQKRCGCATAMWICGAPR